MHAVVCMMSYRLQFASNMSCLNSISVHFTFAVFLLIFNSRQDTMQMITLTLMQPVTVTSLLLKRDFLSLVCLDVFCVPSISELDRDGDGRISFKDFDFAMKYNVSNHF